MKADVTSSLFAAAFCVLLAGSAEAQGTWTTKAPSLLRSVVAVADLNGKIYEVGGELFNARNEVLAPHGQPLLQEYDPATNTWRDLAPMPIGLSHPGAAVLNGKLYVAGGFTIGPPDGPKGGHYGASDSFLVYDPATNQWQTLAPLSSPRGSVGLIAAAGKIHVIGGRGEDQKVIGTHEVYDPATGKWTVAAPLPTPRDHLGIVALDGRIHIIGGSTSTLSVNLPLHDIFDPATGQWKPSTPLPTERSGGAAAVYRGLILYAGGECSPDEKAFVENYAFDPKTGKWTTLTPLPQGLHAHGAASVDDSVYLLGGTHGCGGRRPAANVVAFKLP